MNIGVPREIKADEERVALTPAGALELARAGHTVLVEAGAGEGSGFADEEYRRSGARIVARAEDVWADAQVVVKVKEPEPPEYPYLRPGLVLFTYLHLAANRALTELLRDRKVAAIAYETVQLPDGRLPLLTPMSQVAGRMAPQVGARFLEGPQGGRGILLGGVPGVPPARVVVVGGGTVGEQAARVAEGLGARVTVLDVSADRLRALDERFGGRVTTVYASAYTLSALVPEADLLIGAVLVPGARAPRLVTEDMVRAMKPRSVVVDVAIDQGGSVETVDRATTHRDPVFVKHGVVHYAVANIPGAVPRTSTLALTSVTLPYLSLLAERGLAGALAARPELVPGVNTLEGHVTHPHVAEAHGLPYTPLSRLLEHLAPSQGTAAYPPGTGHTPTQG